jgi:hypothetical protein
MMRGLMVPHRSGKFRRNMTIPRTDPAAFQERGCMACRLEEKNGRKKAQTDQRDQPQPKELDHGLWGFLTRRRKGPKAQRDFAFLASWRLGDFALKCLWEFRAGRPENPQAKTPALRSAAVPGCGFKPRLAASNSARGSLGKDGSCVISLQVATPPRRPNLG